MTTQLDRDIAVAGGLVARLQEHARNSTFSVFVEMYRRHKSGQPPLSVATAFLLGHFMHGEIAASAFKAAKEAGFVTSEKPEGEKYAIYHPTEKLIELVQGIVEVEAFAWEEEQHHKKLHQMISQAERRFEELWPGLLRDHLGQDITLSCMTGRYVVHDGHGDEKVREFLDSLASDDMLTTRKIALQQTAQ